MVDNERHQKHNISSESNHQGIGIVDQNERDDLSLHFEQYFLRQNAQKGLLNAVLHLNHEGGHVEVKEKEVTDKLDR